MVANDVIVTLRLVSPPTIVIRTVEWIRSDTRENVGNNLTISTFGADQTFTLEVNYTGVVIATGAGSSGTLSENITWGNPVPSLRINQVPLQSRLTSYPITLSVWVDPSVTSLSYLWEYSTDNVTYVAASTVGVTDATTQTITVPGPGETPGRGGTGVDNWFRVRVQGTVTIGGTPTAYDQTLAYLIVER